MRAVRALQRAVLWLFGDGGGGVCTLATKRIFLFEHEQERRGKEKGCVRYGNMICVQSTLLHEVFFVPQESQREGTAKGHALE